MIILTIRTDKPEAEIGLYDDQKQLTYEKWHAHRKLAETIHNLIAKNLQLVSRDIADVQGVVVFKGPGSFTGLRIGLSVGNALAAGLGIPIAGSAGNEWITTGIKKLLDGENDAVVLPEYSTPPRITTQKK